MRNNCGRLLRRNDHMHVHRIRVVHQLQEGAETPSGAES